MIDYFPCFVLRTPLLPLSCFSKINGSTDLKQLFFSKREIQEAIFIASPALYEEIIRMYETNSCSEKDAKKLEHSLLKYLIRMSTRPTPFGLFATVTSGKVSKSKHTKTYLCNEFSRRTRLDMEYLCQLASKYSRDDFIKYHIKFFTNNTSYLLNDQLRYIEYSMKNGNRSYKISGIEYNKIISELFIDSKDGLTYEEIVQKVTQYGFSWEDSEVFIDQLIEYQLLVSDLDPSITTLDGLTELTAKLDKIEDKNIEFERTISRLRELKNSLNYLSSFKAGVDVGFYKQLQKHLREFEVDFDFGKLFQIDLVRELPDCYLSEGVVKSVVQAFKHLIRLSSTYPNSALEEFKKDFYERFGEQEIPLNFALDIKVLPPTSENGSISTIRVSLNILPIRRRGF